MLARITGLLESIDEEKALIVFPGAHAGTSQAYEVLLPAFLLAGLADRVGSLVTLHTIQSFDSPDGGSSFTPRLIGFSSTAERRFFELLTTVKGVGTKKALRALSAPVGAIARAITLRDAAALARLPGIGKRLAETVIAELHGKVEGFADETGQTHPEGSAAALHGSDSARQAVGALVNLGEPRAEAERLVREVMSAAKAPESADEILSAALALR